MRTFFILSCTLVALSPLSGCESSQGGDSIDASPAPTDAGAPTDEIAGSVCTYPIVDTNQTSCYDGMGSGVACAGSGQDGAYAGATPTYADNGDGTVTDKVTGLMWEQGMAAKMNFSDIEGYCSALITGGHDDWRVPTIKELYSLIDFSGTTGSAGSFEHLPADAVPYIDATTFAFAYGDTAKGERFIDAQWFSSTVYVSHVMNREPCAFGVNFADGRIKCYPTRALPSGGFRIRCVRGRQDYGLNDFVDNGDQTITDRATGLMWMRQDSASLKAGDLTDGTMDWSHALDFCEQLDFAGHGDWRLPNAKELQSLVDYTRSPDMTSSAAIDPVFKAGPITNEAGVPDYAFYWTGTTHLDGMPMGGAAAYVSFGRAIGQMMGTTMDVHGAGAQRSDPKTGDRKDYPMLGMGPQGDARRVFNLVRCVR